MKSLLIALVLLIAPIARGDVFTATSANGWTTTVDTSTGEVRLFFDMTEHGDYVQIDVATPMSPIQTCLSSSCDLPRSPGFSGGVTWTGQSFQVQFEGGGPSPPVNWVSWSWWPEYEFVGFELVEDNITFSRVEADEAKFTLLLPVFVNPEADVVAITRARYKALERKLIVRAVSDNELAVLTVDGYGEMRWNEEKRFHQRVFRDVDNPGEVTVTSSEGDEDTVVVEVR